MQREFEGLLRETAAEGRTVFLSSHDLDEVQRTADRIAIIKDGRLVAEDTVEGLRRAAPQRMDILFRYPVDPAELRAVTGVTVTAADGPRVTLEVAAASYLLSALAPAIPAIRPARYLSLFYWSAGNNQIGGHRVQPG